MKPYIRKLTRELILPLILLIVAISANLAISAPHDTPKYWKCPNRVGGSWEFGHAPNACDALAFLDTLYAQRVYTKVIYNDSKHGPRERNKYMRQLFPVIRDFSKYYIKRRKPNVSSAELKAWVHATYAIAHQESFWTHYRKSNNSKLKVMRGDFGHGHGIMQVDDRWHFPAIKDGTAWDLLKNISYSLDEYFSAWQKAPKAPCLRSGWSWKNRTRAAYSAYNGGPTKICRWTKPNNTWARNDNGFKTKYLNKQWEDYVTDKNAAAPINVKCVFENNNNCDSNSPSNTFSPAVNGTPTKNAIYKTPNNKLCIFENKKFQCLSAFTNKNTICLRNRLSQTTQDNINLLKLTSTMLNKFGSVNVDDDQFCSRETLEIAGIGASIVLLKNINLRSAPKGNDIFTVIPMGTTVQVLNVEIENYKKLSRYYFVNYGSRHGYIYGGDIEDYDHWTEFTHVPAKKTKLIVKGMLLRITNPAGINLRKGINGSILTTIPVNTQVEVIETKVSPDTKKAHYQVRHRGKVGYIYGGRILPEALTDSLHKWAVQVK